MNTIDDGIIRMMKLEDVPQGVKDEIGTWFHDADYSNYNGTLSVNIESRKIHHVEPINEELVRTFMVRGEFDDEKSTLKVYTILDAGLCKRNQSTF